ncbi:hypothetical protein AB0H83_47420 [Dactylosporangium sp. NPDC050688]|uniref:hypothetical protein n=1 Tax=Dactylosporangium sp. NPDC050688 TaxID=3157217 RepID=UPI003410D161
MGVELGGGPPHRVSDLGGVGEGLSSERGPAQQPPPALAKATPCTVASFAHLDGKKVFDGGPCHRLTTEKQQQVTVAYG